MIIYITYPANLSAFEAAYEALVGETLTPHINGETAIAGSSRITAAQAQTLQASYPEAQFSADIPEGF